MLVHLNILEARHGQGTFVTDLRPALLMEPLDFALSLDALSVLDLFETRRVVECGTAPLAVARITDAQVEELEAHHRACAASVDDVPRFLDHDLAMHELLVDAAGNELLSRVYRSLLAMGTAARRQASERRDVREQALLRHGEIVAARAGPRRRGGSGRAVRAPAGVRGQRGPDARVAHDHGGRVATYQIGIDIGGTHTDAVVLVDDGSHVVAKAPSTPQDYSDGVLASLEVAAGEMGTSVADLLAGTAVFVNGSTVATNVIAQLSGARTGVITTAGFEDTLRIARSARRNGVFDFHRQVPPPQIVPRTLVRGVAERVDYRGEVIVAAAAGGGRAGRPGAARRRRRDDRRLPAVVVPQPRPRAAARRGHPRPRARHAPLAVVRGAPRHPRVRAHGHDGLQLLCRPAGHASTRPAWRSAWRSSGCARRR